MPATRERDRKDHYLPRGFLKGFIDPANKNLAKPLWHFDLETAEWSRESPGSVGWQRGMYDYHHGTNVLEHPDEVFERFEREFPFVREHLLRRNFKGWVKQHKRFLLECAQIMRARSPLFLQQQTAQNENTRIMTVTSVGPGNQVGIDTTVPYPPPVQFIRNRTITTMREEVKKGPDWMDNFQWCIRYTRSVADPFVTGTQPIVVEGRYPNSNDAPVLEDSLVKPACRQQPAPTDEMRYRTNTFAVAQTAHVSDGSGDELDRSTQERVPPLDAWVVGYPTWKLLYLNGDVFRPKR